MESTQSPLGAPAAKNRLEELLRAGADRMEENEVDAATEIFRSAVEEYPLSARAHAGLGISYKVAGDLKAAQASLLLALELDADCLEARYHLGNTLLADGRLDEAERALRWVTAARPAWVYPHNSLGTALLRKALPADAVEAFRRATVLSPSWFLPYFNLGLALIRLGEDLAAMEALRRAIECKPDLAEAHCNLALLLLRHGKFSEGFREYEWRFQNAGLPAHRSGRPQPIWNGTGRRHGTLLLCAEQGAGDLIQFLRFAEPMVRSGFRIVVECPANLKRLFAGCSGVDGVVDIDEHCPEADWQLPMLSLPRVLHLQAEDLPGRIPYLSASVEDVSRMEAAIGAVSGLKIGIVWTGDPRNPKHRERSLTPKDFAVLAEIPGVHLFSLQYQDAGMSPSELASMKIRTLGSKLGDFASAAAAVEAMDLTITVDTSMAHLAGSLGRPVWTLLPQLPDWRWGKAESTCSWYPTMRLYRQGSAGDLFSRVRRDLVAMASL